METKNFESLIEAVTGRKLVIRNNVGFRGYTGSYPEKIEPGIKYDICRIDYEGQERFTFTFNAPQNPEHFLKSFINQFCGKHKEPNPSKIHNWETLPEKYRDNCYLYHSSSMFSKQHLMKQIQDNVSQSGITNVYCRYGFYPTEYGLGIFILFAGAYEMEAITKLRAYMQANKIPFSNEFSDARWVYRFKINVNKNFHTGVLKNFVNSL